MGVRGRVASCRNQLSAYSNRSKAYFFLPVRRTMTDSLARSAAVSRVSTPIDASIIDVRAALLDRPAGIAFALGQTGERPRRRRSAVLLLSTKALGDTVWLGTSAKIWPSCASSRSAISAPKKISVARRAAASPASPWTSRVKLFGQAAFGWRGRRRLRRGPRRALRFLRAASSVSIRRQGPDVGVVDVDPILIELVRAGPLGGEPDGPLLGLAHLRAIGLREQRAGHAVELHAAHPPREIDAGRDVAPLIAAADLQFAADACRTDARSRTPAAACS